MIVAVFNHTAGADSIEAGKPGRGRHVGIARDPGRPVERS